MAEQISSRFAVGMLSGAGSVVVKHVLNISLLPILIATLGFDLFSLYMLLVGVQELILMMDMGFTDALVKMLAGTSKEKTPDKYYQVLKTGHILFSVFAILGLLSALVIVPIYPNWIHLDPSLHGAARFGMTIILIEGAIRLYTTYYQGVLLSECLHQWTNVGDTVFDIVSVAGGLIALLMGYGFEGFVVVRLVAAVLKSVTVISQAARHNLVRLRVKVPLTLRVFKEMAEMTLHSLMVNASVILSHKIDTVVLSLFLPISAVGVYELVFRILGSLMQLCLKVSEGILPLFAKLAALPGSGGARAVFLRISCFNNFFIAGMLVLIGIFYVEVFTFLSAGEQPMAETKTLLLVAIPIIWSGALQIPASYYLYSSGHHKYLTISSFIAAVCNVAISFALVQPLGIVGVALGTFIPQLIQHQFSLIYKTCTSLNISLKDYLMAVHCKVAVLLVAMVSISVPLHPYVVMMVPSKPIMGVALYCSMMFTALSVVWFFWTASAHEKQFLNSRVIEPIKKRFFSVKSSETPAPTQIVSPSSPRRSPSRG